MYGSFITSADSSEDEINDGIVQCMFSDIETAILLCKEVIFYLYSIESHYNSNGSLIVGIEYSIYIGNHKKCNINDRVKPDYFEEYLSDYDVSYDLNDIVNIDNMLFVKESDGYRRIQ